MYTADDVQAFLSRKGKGSRAHTSGKGFGRRGNPKGRDGTPMACHGCGSLEHLIRDCPKGKGKGAFAGIVSQRVEDGGRQAEFTPPWDASDLVFD